MECELKDITIHYEAFGEGRPILVLHGWGMVRGTFIPIGSVNRDKCTPQALHDLEDPPKVLGVADEWILEPEDPWGRVGYVHNVVFCCGAIPEDDSTLKI